MADTGSRMNFAALKRVDPYTKEIIDSATHVALYTFEGNEWEKTNIEGALFVYSRNRDPNHSFIIMNRLNTHNLTEPVSKGLELQLKEPFLLYRNAKCRIYGIWFYDKDECIRVANKLESLLKEPSKQISVDNLPQKPGDTPKTPSAAPIDLCGMLVKAQSEYAINEYHNLKGHTSEKPECQARPPDMTSQSVMDFFAKAGGGAASLPAVSALPPPAMFGPRPADTREGPLLLQRLMSNPAHSVEHIEKQQRSATPQEPQCSNGNVSLDSCARQNSSFRVKYTPVDQNCQTSQQRIPSAKKAQGDGPDTNGPNQLENELSFMHITSPKPSSPLATYLNPSQELVPPVNNFEDLKSEDKGFLPLLYNSLKTSQKPALMPPTMFTATTGSETQSSPEPLTRNQLLQAFNYLLKHDADFVKKLHEAYVKSFSEKAFSVS